MKGGLEGRLAGKASVGGSLLFLAPGPSSVPPAWLPPLTSIVRPRQKMIMEKNRLHPAGRLNKSTNPQICCCCCCCLAENPWAQDHGPHSAPTTGAAPSAVPLAQPASHLWEPLPCARRLQSAKLLPGHHDPSLPCLLPMPPSRLHSSTGTVDTLSMQGYWARY